MTFDTFRRVAQQVYRKQDGRAAKNRPLVPVAGLPKSVQAAAQRYLSRDGGRMRTAGFRWRRLRSDQIFSLDRESKVIELNSLYRDAIRTGKTRGLRSESLVKMLLFILTSRYLDSERISDQQLRQLSALNELICASTVLD